MADSQPSSTSTTSPISQSRFVALAAMTAVLDFRSGRWAISIMRLATSAGSRGRFGRFPGLMQMCAAQRLVSRAHYLATPLHEFICYNLLPHELRARDKIEFPQ